MRRRGHVPWRRTLPLGIVGGLAGGGGRLRGSIPWMGGELFRWELGYFGHMWPGECTPPPHASGFAAEEWVARCTAPGLKGDRAARRPYGSVRRDQTSPHSLENAIVSSIN